MQKIYLCRHGETEWSLSGQHTGKKDLPLTEKGREQTALLRKQIASISFTQIFSSPRLRALESAHGLSPTIDPGLAEWDYGSYEGLTTEEIQKNRPQWNLFKDGVLNGESPEEVFKRAEQFLKKIQPIKGNIAIFSHGHFLRVLTSCFLGLKVEFAQHLSLSVASLSILGYEKGNPVLILWNDICSSNCNKFICS
jgi:broad specificity phosphatase PhoE